MIRTGMVGLGKMGLSHLALVRAHPELDLVAGCDATAYLTDILSKHGGLKCYNRRRKDARFQCFDQGVKQQHQSTIKKSV